MFISSAKVRLNYLKNYTQVAKSVKEIASNYGNARVYVFGSVVTGRYTASSDIDILIVFDKEMKNKEELMARVFMELKDAPVELHITDEQAFRNWYKRFIKEDELVEV